MTTRNVDLNSTEYLEVSSEDCFVASNSAYTVRLFFADAKPLVDVEGAFTLKPNDGFIRSAGFPAGILWGKCLEEDVTAKVSVNE